MPFAPPPPQAPPAPPPPEPPKRRFFRTPPTLGMWIGLAGMLVFLLATALPWYTVSGKFPDYGYPDWTLLIQFDGLRGLYVAPELRSQVGFEVPSLFFPLSLIFGLLSYRKFIRLARAENHARRAKLLFRGCLHIAIAVVITVILIMSIATVVPGSAPQQAKDLAHSVSTHPFGGEENFSVEDPVLGSDHNGSLRWGFGPALQVMGLAAGLLVVGALLESGAGRKAERRGL